MELIKVQVDELRGFEPTRLKQIEEDVRKELLGIRMDIYTPKGSQAGKIRGLKKTLARVKCVQTEKCRIQVLRTKTKEVNS